MIEEKTIQEIFTNRPIYSFDKFENTIETKNNIHDYGNITSLKKEYHGIFEKLLTPPSKVRFMCLECKKEQTFNVFIKTSPANERYYNVFPKNNTNGKINLNILNELDSDFDIIAEYTFTCTLSNDHIYKMWIRIKLNSDGTLIFAKIGQDPVNNELLSSYSNTYSSILKRYSALADYKNFEASQSRNLLVGCCAYLRRILEKIVLKKAAESGLKKEDYNHFSNLIDALKDKFSPEIVDLLPKIYSLLSKGIHELEENEIEVLYNDLSEIILFQLDYEKEQIDRSKRLKELRNSINNNYNQNK